jgi:hypothetical protein
MAEHVMVAAMKISLNIEKSSPVAANWMKSE